MAKARMDDAGFYDLVQCLQQETDSPEKKIDILYTSNGSFDHQQVSVLLHQFRSPAHKVRAIRMLEPRLCQMSCQEAGDIIGAISVHNDKLQALNCIKRAIVDSQTKLGEEYIVGSFAYEPDKRVAAGILKTVKHFPDDYTAAGGHQGYAALGGLYTQARPLDPHLYGDIETQRLSLPGQGQIEIPITAQPGVVPSIYTGHPSYAYPPDMSYQETRGYPGNRQSHDNYEQSFRPYPSGAPPLGNHCGAPSSTGFPRLETLGYY